MAGPRHRKKNARDISTCHPDVGISFIEVLVSIVLLGTAVVSILVALRVTVIGTALARDHAKAHEWLQSASEILVNDVTYLDCDSNTATQVRDGYELDLRAASTIVPDGWSAPQISVLAPVTFGQSSGLYAATCAADVDRQLVRLEVTDTDGRIVEQVEVVVVP